MFVVFDLDGTLADISHRVHHVRGAKSDWESFFAECVHDVPNTPVINALRAHVFAGHDVEIWSARSDIVRNETEAWLWAQGIDPRRLVHMRAAGDNTPDAVLKRHWLNQLHPDERPDVIYDDRQRVVDMWREEGIACFQVAANWEAPAPIAPVSETILVLLVGPSGAGKSTHAAKLYPPRWIISSDALREDYCGSIQDQSRNDDVFAALHRIVKTRLDCGLPTVVDATNLRRRDRLSLVALCPPGTRAEYTVIDRPLVDKLATAGWRASVIVKGVPLVEAHHDRMRSSLKDILAGDGLPNVSVRDLRPPVCQIQSSVAASHLKRAA